MDVRVELTCEALGFRHPPEGDANWSDSGARVGETSGKRQEVGRGAGSSTLVLRDSLKRQRDKNDVSAKMDIDVSVVLTR